MTVLTRGLTDRWQLNYDTEARQLFVSLGGLERPIHEFLASESTAQNELELLIMDMFPNNANDAQSRGLTQRRRWRDAQPQADSLSAHHPPER
jgi:hypothetical protein